MSTTSGGPNVVTDGLVLNLDAANVKSYARSLGGELITNSTILSKDGNTFNVFRTSTTQQNLNLCSVVAGRHYAIECMIINYIGVTSASFRINGSGGNLTPIITINTAGTFNILIQALVTGTLSITGNNTGTDFEVDFVSVKEMLDNNSIILKDISRSENNGTLINGVGYSSERGGSLVFDGINDYVTTTANPSTLGMIGGNFTVSCWFYCDNLSITNGGLINSRTFDSAGNCYEMGIRSNELWAGFYGNDQYIPILNNVWYHVVHTYNYTTKVSKVYLNNILKNIITRTIDLQSTANLRIGIYSGNIRVFNGKINIIQIYNKEITAQEVQQNYNATKTRFGL